MRQRLTPPPYIEAWWDRWERTTGKSVPDCLRVNRKSVQGPICIEGYKRNTRILAGRAA